MMQQWISKIAALALAFALLGIIWVGVAVPLSVLYASNQQTLIDRADLLRRWQTKFVQQRQLTEASRLAAAPDYKGHYMTGDNDALITAQLQAKLRNTLAKHKAVLRSAQNLPARKASKVEYLGVRLQFAGTVRSTRNILHDVESQMPFLFIERLNMQAPHLRVPGQLPRNGVAHITTSMEIRVAKWSPEVASKSKGQSQ